MSESTPTTADLVSRYSQSFNDDLLAQHGVSSALGLWLLLALLAPGTAGEARTALEEALGTNAEEAARRAGELLDNPHPALAAAVALWARPEMLSDNFDKFSSGLPPVVTQGPIPHQEEADAWANENTLGLIQKFPLRLDPLIAVVLASALATKGEWSQPFDTAASSDLGGDFGQQVTEALRSTPAHQVFIVRTEPAGLVGVHSAHTTDGLQVISVIGVDTATPAQLHSAASEVAQLLQGDNASAQRVSLFDLPLGDGAAWSIEEREYEGVGPSKLESLTAVLATWEIESKHDLAACPGVPESFTVLSDWLRAEQRPGEFGAKQVVLARYTKLGFEAAAITAMFASGFNMPGTNHITERTATVRFNRPYAVLALADITSPDPSAPWNEEVIAPQAWRGVPAFAAWVGHVNEDSASTTELP